MLRPLSAAPAAIHRYSSEPPSAVRESGFGWPLPDETPVLTSGAVDVGSIAPLIL